MSYIKEIGYMDTHQFKRDADEYWAPKKITLEAEEYDSLVSDSHQLQDALDRIELLTKLLQQANNWVRPDVALSSHIREALSKDAPR